MSIVYLAILIATCWGGSFVVIKHVTEHVPPFLAVSLRVGMAWAFLTIYFLLTRKAMTVPRKYLLNVWLTGILSQGLPFALLFIAEKSVSAGFAGIMNGTAPLWAYLFGSIFLRHVETFTTKKLFSIILGFVGVLVIFWPKLRMNASEQELIGGLAAVGMAISYGLSFAMNRRLLSGAKGIDLHGSLYQQEISSLMLLIPLTLLNGQWQNTGWLEHASTIIPGLLYLGVLSTAIGSLVYLWLLREWGMIRASVMVYIIPVSAVVLDMIIYHNLPHLAELLGGMVIILGVMLVQDNNIVLEFVRRKRTGALLTR